MISKCQTVTVAKKKFSDFEYINSIDGVYLVGYIKDIDETGAEYTYNVRINASDIEKRTEPEIFDKLNPCGGEGYDTFETASKDVVYIFETENFGTFIQLNDLTGTLDSDGYLHIALSKNTAPGTRVDIVITNFEVGSSETTKFKGVKLHASCPTASGSKNTDTLYTINEAEENAPLYISLIELAPEDDQPAITVCTNVAVNMGLGVDGREDAQLPPVSEPIYY